MKNKFLEGDWIKTSRRSKKETFNKGDFALKFAGEDILARFLSGKNRVVPKSWAENMGEALTEADLKALIGLSLDLLCDVIYKLFRENKRTKFFESAQFIIT